MKKSTAILGWHMAKLAAFNLWKHHRIDFPTAIGIETSTACNRRCHYCPQSVEPHKQQFITDEVWDTFLFRIGELRWKGFTAITKYNEPSLNPKSGKYISQLAALGCRPAVFSNGDRPTAVRMWCEAGAKHVVITEHPKDGVYDPDWIVPLLEIQRDYPRVIKISRLKFVHNQAGMVEGEKMDYCFSSHGLSCNIDGTVSMCCVDYKSEALIGDIKRDRMIDIWNSERHREIRRKVIRGIPATELCKNCLT